MPRWYQEPVWKERRPFGAHTSPQGAGGWVSVAESGEGARRRPAAAGGGIRRLPCGGAAGSPTFAHDATGRPGAAHAPNDQRPPPCGGLRSDAWAEPTPHRRAARPNVPRPVLVKRDCAPLVSVSLSTALIKGRRGGLAAGAGPVAPGRHRQDHLLAAHRAAFLGQHLGRGVQGAELAGLRRGVGRTRLRRPGLAAPFRPGRRLRGLGFPGCLRRGRGASRRGSGASSAAWAGGCASCVSATASAPGTSEPAPSCCTVWAPTVSAAVPSAWPTSTTAAGGPSASAVSATAACSFGAFLRFAAGVEVLPLFFAMMLLPSIRVVHVGVAPAATPQPVRTVTSPGGTASS